MPEPLDLDLLPAPAPRQALPRLPLLSRRIRLSLAAAAAAVLAGMLATAALPPLLARLPHPPERLPAPLQHWLAQRVAPPDWHALRLGPVLAEASRRGVLVVGVRAYARPAPPGAPAPAEPDAFDASLARQLAAHLGLRLRLVGLLGDAGNPGDPRNAPVLLPGPRPDLLLAVAGAVPAAPAAARVPTAYTGGMGQVLVLRKSAYRHPADLARRSVCVAQGSPYAHTLAARYGALPRTYASAIRAVSAFLAGECDGLADDTLALARLARLPEWRFYRALDGAVAPDNGAAQIVLRAGDPLSAAYVERAVRYWKSGGALAQARERRAADLAFEAGQLQDGLVCHN